MKQIFAYGNMFLLVILICSNFGSSGGCLDDERMAIEEALDSMGYQFESFPVGGYSDDCCQWEGIDCSLTSSRVVGISFYHLKEGAELWFPDMSLFARIEELQQLSLVGDRIGGLVNQEALCSLTNLQELDLSYNLIDDVPSCLANMSSLRILNLSKNQFQGDITIFSNLSNLEKFDVSNNLFQGPIPLSTFANLSKLIYLDLSYNHLSQVKSESPTWHPAFKIRHLFLAGCNLNNGIGNHIPLFLSSQSNLHTLDLSDNFLKGPFPAWMLHNVSSALRLRGNSFVGEFPNNHYNLESELGELDISCNLFHGQLPSNISIFLPKLYGFNVSSNGFTGTIPPSFGELKDLQHLDLSSNRLFGAIPSGISKISALWYLNLSNNSLNGELLPKDCNMTKLRWLLLHHNLFDGNMPSCLSNSSSLFMLDVRNNNLAGTISEKMPVFSALGALLLGANHFGGSIPRQLCQMQNLQFLDLSHNDFLDSIPSCLNNNSFWKQDSQANSWVPTGFTTKGNSYFYQGIPLTVMTGIDLSANRLIGSIPEQLGELQALRSLNSSHNLLTGSFPASFKNLKNLESLDLSHNRLTGKIPPEVAHMTFLTTFSVAFNNLSGRIPFDEQLSTFSESSYIGNPRLCGEPLQTKCSEIEYQDDGNAEENNSKEDGHKLVNEPVFFYAFVFMSYALGFWGFVAPLCLNRNWRRTYYTAIDKCVYYFYEMF